jgi:hypothetical protein
MAKKINLDETINMINNLTKENDKKTYMDNLSEVNDRIKLIDDILEKKSELTEELSIDKLFEMLEKYQNYIDNDVSINVLEFKKIKDIVELLEKKLNDNKVEITEIA